MEVTEDEVIEKYAKHCGHCNRNTLLPYKNEGTCHGCGNFVIKRKHEFSKIQRKKINFINLLKYAEQKNFGICIDVFVIFEGKDYDDYDKMYKVLSTLKNKKLKIGNIFIEKYKNMLENPNFKQDYWSRTADGI